LSGAQESGSNNTTIFCHEKIMYLNLIDTKYLSVAYTVIGKTLNQ